MDLSQYAELFLAESREHLSACNQLLLEWERHPAASEPVGGIFRAVHTVKGMAATMGYGRVADLAHRMENLLDHLRRGGKPPTDDTLQLLFRANDALEKAVGLAVAGRERELDITALLTDFDRAAGEHAPKTSATASPRRPAASTAPVSPIGTGRLVTVTIRAEAPIKGGRATLIIRKAQKLGRVDRIQPPSAAFEADDFDGRFTFELDTAADAAQIETAIRAVGDVDAVTIGGGEEAHVTPGESAAAVGGRSKHIRVDLRRLDTLMDLIGELVTVRGRLNEVAERGRPRNRNAGGAHAPQKESGRGDRPRRGARTLQRGDQHPRRRSRDRSRARARQGEARRTRRAAHRIPLGRSAVARARPAGVFDGGRGHERLGSRRRHRCRRDTHSRARRFDRDSDGAGKGHGLCDASAGHARDRARADRRGRRRTVRTAAHLRRRDGRVWNDATDDDGWTRRDRIA